jgi:hypothetical protein
MVVGPESEIAAVIIDPGMQLIRAPYSNLEQTAQADDATQLGQSQVDVIAGQMHEGAHRPTSIEATVPEGQIDGGSLDGVQAQPNAQSHSDGG